MIRALVTSALALGLLVMACNNTDTPPTSGTPRGMGATGGTFATGGSGGSTSAGSGGSSSASGGSGGDAGSTGGSSASGGSGGDAGSTGGSSASGGSSGSGGSGDDASVDASMEADGPMSMVDGSVSSGDAGANGPGPGVVPLPGKAGDYICPLNATHEQCCTMLCECVNRICLDSPKAKPGIANCMPTCMKLSDMLTRCHVYHCYESVSPSGVKDHDSHCGHAANQVNGGACPPGVSP